MSPRIEGKWSVLASKISQRKTAPQPHTTSLTPSSNLRNALQGGLAKGVWPWVSSIIFLYARQYIIQYYIFRQFFYKFIFFFTPSFWCLQWLVLGYYPKYIHYILSNSRKQIAGWENEVKRNVLSYSWAAIKNPEYFSRGFSLLFHLSPLEAQSDR